MSDGETIVLPNEPGNVLLQLLDEELREGRNVRINFGGCSMLPLIDGDGDTVELRPLREAEACRVGEIYLFVHEGHHIVHRLMAVEEDGTHRFRGDNCYGCERVGREQVLAQLSSITRPDGTVVDCGSAAWREQSRRVVRRRNRVNALRRCLSPERRRRLAVGYYAVLLVLMWAPLNGVGIPLDNFILGLRVDHLLHASVYLLCPLALYDWLHKRKGLILAATLLTGICTECVQYVLPYRGFDINDLCANFIGGFAGWLLLLAAVGLCRRRRNMPLPR